MGNALSGVKLKKTVPNERPVDPTEKLIAAIEKQPEHFPKLQKTEEEWKALLTAEEYAILRGKGTEAAGSGEYDRYFPAPSEGHFVCRACKQPLYSAAAKFDSGCGWPAFDKCYKDSIRMAVDQAYGIKRIEITCGNCGGHLGHVFLGEKHSDTDERHCVNAMSIKFVKGIPEGMEEQPLSLPA